MSPKRVRDYRCEGRRAQVVNWPAACMARSVIHAGISMQKMNARAVTITAVEIALFDGTSVAGRICVPAQGRASDVLNDERDGAAPSWHWRKKPSNR